ncbi:MAG: Crp/Fnr family transcriptional regulator [Acidobacteriota bacterium]
MDFRDTRSNFTNDHYEDNHIQTGRWTEPSANLILNELSPEMRGVIEPALKTVFLSKEQFLYQEEDHLDYIYFPVTAVVSEFKMLEDGRMVEISVTGREGAIGLSSLFSDSHVVSNCVQVTHAGEAKRVDAATFEKLLRTNEKIRTGMSHFVDTYIRQISQKAICNMYHSVRERFCTCLLMIQDRCGMKTLKLTHEQIARTLGVYRPSITYIAQELRESSMINYSRGGILIRDRKRIEQAACSCYVEMGC